MAVVRAQPAVLPAAAGSRNGLISDSELKLEPGMTGQLRETFNEADGTEYQYDEMCQCHTYLKMPFRKNENIKLRFDSNGPASPDPAPGQKSVGPGHVLVDPVYRIAPRGELKTADTHCASM